MGRLPAGRMPRPTVPGDRLGEREFRRSFSEFGRPLFEGEFLEMTAVELIGEKCPSQPDASPGGVDFSAQLGAKFREPTGQGCLQIDL